MMPPLDAPASNAPPTLDRARFVVLASAPVAVGFGLLGIESIADATEDELEQLLEKLVTHRQSAMVFVEENLARGGGRWLTYVRDQSTSVILVEIPGLKGAQEHESAIEGLIRVALGLSSTEPRR